MAYRFTSLGPLVFTNPAEAHRVLTEEFQRGLGLEEVAAAHGVSRQTAWRWCHHLIKQGLGDPRDAVRTRRLGRRGKVEMPRLIDVIENPLVSS